MGKWRWLEVAALVAATLFADGHFSLSSAGSPLTPPSDLAAPPGFTEPYNKKAQYSAARVWGFIGEQIALLSECSEFYKENAIAYVDATERYFQRNAPLMDRADRIIQEENRRDGKTPEHIVNILFDLQKRAADGAAAERAHDPATFAVFCSNAPGLIRSQRARFARSPGSSRTKCATSTTGSSLMRAPAAAAAFRLSPAGPLGARAPLWRRRACWRHDRRRRSRG
jgi:hypothetical protein